MHLVGQPRTVTERDGAYTYTPAIGPDPSLVEALGLTGPLVEVRCNRPKGARGRPCACLLAIVGDSSAGVLMEVTRHTWDDTSPAFVLGRSKGVKAPAVTEGHLTIMVEGVDLVVTDHGQERIVPWEVIVAALQVARGDGRKRVLHPA